MCMHSTAIELLVLVLQHCTVNIISDSMLPTQCGDQGIGEVQAPKLYKQNFLVPISNCLFC